MLDKIQGFHHQHHHHHHHPSPSYMRSKILSDVLTSLSLTGSHKSGCEFHCSCQKCSYPTGRVFNVISFSINFSISTLPGSQPNRFTSLTSHEIIQTSYSYPPTETRGTSPYYYYKAFLAQPLLVYFAPKCNICIHFFGAVRIND